MPALRLLTLTISLSVAFPVFAEDPGTLLSRILNDPGRHSQMCSTAPRVPDDALPLYSQARREEHSLSEANIRVLEQRRAEVVPEIVKRLRQVDSTSKLLGQKIKIYPYLGTNGVSGGMLDIIVLLRAVESLPELLRIEADLEATLNKAEKDPSVLADNDEPKLKATFPSLDRPQWRLTSGRIFQRELLSIMAALLRQQRFQPLLDSEMEKSYLTFLKKQAQGDALKDIKSPADVHPKQKGWITFDPIHNLPVANHAPEFMPYTSQLRLEIRGWVSDFLKQPPAAKSGSPPTPK